MLLGPVLTFVLMPSEGCMAGAGGVDAVAVVTSAGGLSALTTVLHDLPDDLPVPVVVQQHLGGHGSSLVRILRQRTGRDVMWAVDGTTPGAGQVVVCPPMTRLELLPDGTCAVIESAVGAREFPHDALLESMADAYAARGVAVVLTGLGRDGAAGAAQVRAAGGFVVVQSPDTAEYASMPGAAAQAAHLSLPLGEIGTVIGDLVRGRPLPKPRSEIEAAARLFPGSGEIERLLRSKDWAGTPLGPVTQWSPELRVLVRTTLDSGCPMAVWWGPDLIQIYNEQWRQFLGAAKHPQALIGRARQTWSELWPVIAPMIEDVRTRGAATGRENMPVLMDRNGLLEEVFLTFSYAPVRDATGAVVGIHNLGWDTTATVVAERRMHALRSVATLTAGAETTRRACERAATALASDSADVPFALLYLLDHSMQRAHLAGAAGLDPGSVAAPHVIDFAGRGTAWPPLAPVLREPSPPPGQTGGILVEGLRVTLDGLPAGTYTPDAAFLLPVHTTVDDPPEAVLVAGLNPHRPFDDGYRGFLDLLAGQVGAALAQAQTRQREQQRLEKLAELDRAKTEFVSNVSHEFRTPLTLMLGPLEEMLRDSADHVTASRTDVALVERNARRLLRLVGTLLDFSAAEAGRLLAAFAPTDLARLTGDIASMFRGAAQAAGLKLTIDTPPLPEPVHVDAEMWEKIVANLLSNALKFTWEGSIDVTLRALPQHVELVVRDTGVGIPADEVPLVSQRFHRVRDARARTHEGAGIGLALAHQLVRAHHGRIRVTSDEGAGTTCTVWIPRKKPVLPRPPVEEPVPAGRLAAAMADEAAQWDGAREDRLLALGLEDTTLTEPLPRRAPGARVLVVDDNADMRDYLARLLAGRWQVTQARDGAQALQQVRSQPPDLVLADVMMPGTDGFALLREIRSDARLARLPVVLVTARDAEYNAIDGLLAGADDYIVKPFTARELVARVGAQLELSRTRHAAEERLRRVLETDAVGVLYFDRTGTVVDANQVFLTMTGHTRAEIEQGELTWRKMTPPEWTPISEQQLNALATTGRIGPYEKQYILADGTRRWMLFVGRDLGDGTMSEYCIDITDLKGAETA